LDVWSSDEDLDKKFVKHKSRSKMKGTATADKDGSWVYVPQFQFVPGEYSAVASISDSKLGNIQSDRVFFTVVDGKGASQWSIINQTWIWIGIGILIFIFLLAIFLIFRKKIFPGKLQPRMNSEVEPSVFDFNSNKNQVLKIIDYDNSENNRQENLENLNEESLEAEKEIVDVAKEVNESMKKVAELKRNIAGKNEQMISKSEIEQDLNQVEEELLNTTKEVSEAASKVEDMRGEIIEKMRRRK